MTDPEEEESKYCRYHGDFPSTELFCPVCEKWDAQRKGE